MDWESRVTRPLHQSRPTRSAHIRMWPSKPSNSKLSWACRSIPKRKPVHLLLLLLRLWRRRKMRKRDPPSRRPYSPLRRAPAHRLSPLLRHLRHQRRQRH